MESFSLRSFISRSYNSTTSTAPRASITPPASAANSLSEFGNARNSLPADLSSVSLFASADNENNVQSSSNLIPTKCASLPIDLSSSSTSTLTSSSSIENRPPLAFTMSIRNLRKTLPPKPDFIPRIPSSNEKELMKILESKDLCCVFRQWCKLQHCEENLAFWVDVELYKKSFSTADHHLQMAEAIYQKYFADDCPLPINADAELVSELNRQRAELEFSLDCFDKLQSHVFSLMADGCVPRFLESDLLMHWKVDQQKGLLSPKPAPKNTTLRIVSKLRREKTPLAVSQDRLNIETLFLLQDGGSQDKQRGSFYRARTLT